jgi:hypothetical protein
MNTYKTRDGEDYTIPGVGRTVDGRIETESIIENPNFELVSGDAPQNIIATAEPDVVSLENAQPEQSNGDNE